jgi:predicted PurR-regulated permease PerM
MQIENDTIKKLLTRDIFDFVVRVSLIAFLVVMSVRVFAPFAGLMLWALILAIALYPLQRILSAHMGGRQGRTATVIVLSGLLIIGIPTAMLADSFASHLHGAHEAFENNTISLPQPDARVAEWPLIGKKVYNTWSAAAENLSGFVKKNKEKLKNLSKRALSLTANTLGSIMLFIGALIIAGIMMAYGEAGTDAMRRILSRIAGPDGGPRLQVLSTATVRSVAAGVIGVAFIQALLLGIGFFLAGIPGPGVLALIVLLIGILQLPALVISLPAIAWLWISGDASTVMNVVFTIYLLVAGMADNVLKPLLLGRGVDVPMPVILIGALGGMIMSGIIGLFVGAVLLAVGYQLFMEWVDQADANSEEATGET